MPRQGGLLALTALGAVLLCNLRPRRLNISNVELSELHHDKKKMASGTAIKTAELIRSSRVYSAGALDEEELIAGSSWCNF